MTNTNIFKSKTLALSSLIFALYFTACTNDRAKDMSSFQQSYPITHPLVIDTGYEKEYVADIQSPQHVELRARVKGFLEKIHVDEGQEVRQGQLLFTLSSQEYRDEWHKAKALLKSAIAESKMAEVELQNTRTLVEKNIVSKSELAMAEAKLEAIEAKMDEAKSAISSAELNLSFTQIKAPFTGIINRIPNKQGSLIEEGMLLTTLSSNHDVFAYFNVSEKEYFEFAKQKSLNQQQNVTLLLANGEVHPYKGTIETAETVIDKSTGNIAFRARFLNPGHLLKHGASGKVVIRHELKDALVIPQKSTFDVQDKTYVYVLDEENTIRRRAIVPKTRIGHLCVVESGLTKDDRLIYEGIQRVREGEKVTTELVPLEDIMQTFAMR